MVLQPRIMHKIDKTKTKTITSAQSQFPLKGKKNSIEKSQSPLPFPVFSPNQI